MRWFNWGTKKTITGNWNGMSLLSEIAKGAAWATGGQWAIQIIQFATSIVIARILSPADYGIVAMSLVFTNFIILFGNLGFGPALVHKKNLDPEYISVAFTITSMVALLLFLVMWFASPWVGVFYQEPKVALIIRVVGFGLLFTPISSVLHNLLIRDMRFKEIAIIQICCSLVSQVTALISAFSGLGVWSLVLGGLAFQALRMPAMLWRLRWKPQFRIDKRRVQELFGFGGNLLAYNFLNYFSRNLDNLIIGKFLGAFALGFYDLAYQVMLKPIQNVSDKITLPLFPALSKIQDDRQQSAETYLKVVYYVAAITFPMMFGLLSVAHVFVPGVLGEKWLPVVPVLQTLAVVGAIQSIYVTVGDIYKSQGKTGLMLKTGALGTLIYTLSFFAGLPWGIVGVALCYLMGSILYGIITQSIACRLIDVTLFRLFKVLLPCFTRSVLMALFVYGLSMILIQMKTDLVISLFILVASGVVFHVVTILLSRDEETKFIKNIILDRLQHIIRVKGKTA